MKNFVMIVFALLTMIVLPTIVSAQPAPPPPGAYHIVERCYTVLFPYPHSRCEYVRVRRDYTPVPHPPHFRPVPPPPNHRPGHHPPPPPGGRNHVGPGPRR